MYIKAIEISNLYFAIRVFLTNTVNVGIGSVFSIGPGSAFSKGPVYKVCHLMVNTRGVFRTQSKIYDEAFFRK